MSPAVAARDRSSGAVAMIPCTQRQLEVFLAAAEDCHFVCTASRLGISQAAVSNTIAALENQLGRPLFVRRRGRKPVLSSYGHTLLAEARSRTGKGDSVAAPRISPVSAAPRTVHVGAGGHLLDDYIKPCLPEFHRQNADIDITCHYVNCPSQCARLVEDGEMDMMVYTVANPADFPLHSEILRSVEFGLYAGRQFLASRHASPAEVSTLPFVLPPENVPAYGMVQSALLAAGIVCRKVAAHAQYATVAKDMAREGEGVVALFDTMIAPGDADNLIRLDIELPPMYRTLFRRANDAACPAFRNVERFLRDTLAD